MLRLSRLGKVVCLCTLAFSVAAEVDQGPEVSVSEAAATGIQQEASEANKSATYSGIETDAQKSFIETTVGEDASGSPVQTAQDASQKNGDTKVGLPKTTSRKPSMSETSNWPYVLLVLLAMIACIMLMAWILRRFSGVTGVGGRDLRVVNAIGLGARERVAVIDVKGQQFLVGVTPHNISLLHAFNEAPIQTKQATGSSEFAEKLQKLLKGADLTPPDGGKNEASKS